MPEVPLAYKYVALAVMLVEVNYCATRLKLGMSLPARVDDAKRAFVAAPGLIGFGGRIDFENYAFSFTKSSHLRYITKLQAGTMYAAGIQPPAGVPLKEHFTAMAKKRSLIDVDDAFSLATNWLAAIEVDVQQLMKEQPCEKQQLIIQDSLKVPIFTIRWGTPGKRPFPRVSVIIDGSTKELLELRQEDISYSNRPSELMVEVTNLLKISDADFEKFTTEQKNALLQKHKAKSASGVNP